jgi:ABC-type uncharacterized transport system ATPase subunit
MAVGEKVLVRLDKISKAFGPVRANQDISLNIKAGTITALLGENGAGKSTLMSILAGQLVPDSGAIYIDDCKVSLNSTRSAIGYGIGMVYQHFKLIDAMTVSENIFLGQEAGPLLNRDLMRGRVRELARDSGLEIDPDAKVASLSMGEKQRVEILRLLHRDSRILIFDEPTAVLTPPEIEQLFRAMKQLSRQGRAIIFISHKLAEVLELADEIAILRRGSLTEQMAAGAVTSRAELARKMVGREVILQVDRHPLEPRQRVLSINRFSDDVLQDMDLELRQGEILGLVGVAGNGQKRLVEIVCGLHRPSTGNISIFGKKWQQFYRSANRDNLLSYIPEDRQGLATCPRMNLLDNFLITTRHAFCTGPWLLKGPARKKAADLIKAFDVQPGRMNASAWQLSGGNLQKLVLAREFFRRPRLIVAEQPTQGLDIGATEEVWNLLLQARERAGILLVTGDLKEALSLSDRIAVIYSGKLIDTFPVSDAGKVEQIGLMMAGLQH